jgi:hypothetical protein
MYESGIIYPAKIKYDSQNLDMAIHDSHYKASPNEHKCFPHDFFNESYTKQIYIDIYNFLRSMKNIDLFKIDIKDVPDNITVQQMVGIIDIIEEQPK